MASQSTGIFPTDLHLDIEAQELLEEFHQEHGLPNEAERLLLARIVQKPLNIIRDWCESKCNAHNLVVADAVFDPVVWKESRMAVPLRREREHKVAALRPMPSTQFSSTWKPQKPPTRH